MSGRKHKSSGDVAGTAKKCRCCTVLVYLPRYCNVRSKMFSLSFVFVLYVLFVWKVLQTYYSAVGLPGDSVGKESTCNVGYLGLTQGLGRFLGEGNGYQLQYSGLENSMDCIVHGVTESDTTERLSLSLFKKAIIVISNGQRQWKVMGLLVNPWRHSFAFPPRLSRESTLHICAI